MCLCLGPFFIKGRGGGGGGGAAVHGQPMDGCGTLKNCNTLKYTLVVFNMFWVFCRHKLKFFVN